MKDAILVFLGGGLGAVLRYLVSVLSISLIPAAGLPAGTLTVNLIGCFFIGFTAPYFLAAAAEAADLRLLFVTGMLGGFTTFSAFGFEVVELIRTGNASLALCYVAVSVCGGVVLAATGFWLRH